ncbi:hypothetical protein AVEN_216393-1 [Araneus ventricosus]|uniref:Uncharacterized protein n=1 Tax=Araneus ventricosus TaxID=182803 RepID=A0A4Y2WHS9_ARAVE|nr:hypothetical protein AVEN_216393-1 [Araneus ventricosus]
MSSGYLLKEKIASVARPGSHSSAKAPHPGREPTGRALSSSKPKPLSVPDRRQTKNFSHRPQTGEKHHHFQFKGQLEGGKAEFLQCARTESHRGVVFPGNSSPARVNNF